MRGVEGVETQMVGRELEFLQLQKTLDGVMEEGEEQMVTVVGAAGLGKSRLLYEFENWVDLRPEEIWLYKGRARLETQGLPYGLLRDLFVFRFGILDDDPAQAVKDKLLNGFGEVFGREEEGEKKAHIIGQLLGYNFEGSLHLKGVLENPQQLRDQATMYLASYFKALARQDPVLILLEDLHWADETSLDAINGLAIELKDHPVLILGAARHGLLERRPHWGEGQEFHRRILLEPLSKRESRRLVAEVLQRVQNVPETLSELVVRNAEGNPFYVEELIKMLVEDGVILREDPHWRVETGRLEDVHVPSTLTGVLQARLDGLTEEERKALQGASVIGRVFWDKILEHINTVTADRITERQVAEVLDELRSRELIFQRETSAFAEAREHIFKHALLREVTYESVLKRVRQAYHALVAEWLIEHAGDRAGEFTGLIADHLEASGNDSRAGHYLLQAGKQAAKKFANQEAVSYLSRALNITAETDLEARYEILLEREQVYDVIGKREVQEADLVDVELLADALDDQSKQAETALRRANYADQLGIYQSSLEAAQRAVRIAQEIGKLEQEAAGQLAWGRSLWKQYKFDQANPKFEQVLDLAKKIKNRQLEANALRHLGIIAGNQQDDSFALAIEYHQQCLGIYREIGDRIGELTVLNNLAIYYAGLLDFEMALDYHEKQLALSSEIGHKSLAWSAINNMSDIYLNMGDYKKSRSVMEQSLEVSRQLNNYTGMLDELWWLGYIAYRIQEDYEGARNFAEEGLSVARKAGNLPYESGHLYLLAYIFIGLEKWSEAEDLFKKSIEIFIDQDLEDYLHFRRDGLAYLYLLQERLEQAVEQVNLILEIYDTQGIKELDTGVFFSMEVCCQVLKAAKDPRFHQIIETAYNHLQNLANKIKREDYRYSFLNNIPWHKEIIAMWEAENKHN
jgi:predicted ATPase